MVQVNRPIVKLRLNGYEMEAIIIQAMKIENVTMSIPPAWSSYEQEWSKQESDSDCIDAQLLLGSNQAVLHP